MNNKVLIKLIVPELDSTYDVFIPVNELVWKIKKLVIKCVYDLTEGSFPLNQSYLLINKDSSYIYKNNELIRTNDIRNATELVLISCK